MRGRSDPPSKGWATPSLKPLLGESAAPGGRLAGVVPAFPAAAVLRVAGAGSRGQQAAAERAEQRRGLHGAGTGRQERPGAQAPAGRSPPPAPLGRAAPLGARAAGGGPGGWPIAERPRNFPPIVAALAGAGGQTRVLRGAGVGAPSSVSSVSPPPGTPAPGLYVHAFLVGLLFSEPLVRVRVGFVPSGTGVE